MGLRRFLTERAARAALVVAAGMGDLHGNPATAQSPANPPPEYLQVPLSTDAR
jgi:hypothetical protein